MNIQIFGRSKCFDTKKAERYFKERRIKYQLIDIDRFSMSKGELSSVISSGIKTDELMNTKCPLYESKFVAYLSRTDEEKRELLRENPQLFRTPIVRNGKAATLGFMPDVWKNWE